MGLTNVGVGHCPVWVDLSRCVPPCFQIGGVGCMVAETSRNVGSWGQVTEPSICRQDGSKEREKAGGFHLRIDSSCERRECSQKQLIDNNGRYSYNSFIP